MLADTARGLSRYNLQCRGALLPGSNSMGEDARHKETSPQAVCLRGSVCRGYCCTVLSTTSRVMVMVMYSPSGISSVEVRSARPGTR